MESSDSAASSIEVTATCSCGSFYFFFFKKEEFLINLSHHMLEGYLSAADKLASPMEYRHSPEKTGGQLGSKGGCDIFLACF